MASKQPHVPPIFYQIKQLNERLSGGQSTFGLQCGHAPPSQLHSPQKSSSLKLGEGLIPPLGFLT